MKLDPRTILRRLVAAPAAPPAVTTPPPPAESARVRDERVRVGTRCANAGISADPALTVAPGGTDEEKLAALAVINTLVNAVVKADLDSGGVEKLSADAQGTRRSLRSPDWDATDVANYVGILRFERRDPVVADEADVSFPVTRRAYAAPGAEDVMDRCAALGLPTAPALDAQTSHDQTEVAAALASIDSLLDRVEEIEAGARDGGMAEESLVAVRGRHFDEAWGRATVESYADALDEELGRVGEASEPGPGGTKNAAPADILPAGHLGVLGSLAEDLTVAEAESLAALSLEELEELDRLSDEELAAEDGDDSDGLTESPEAVDGATAKARPDGLASSQR